MAMGRVGRLVAVAGLAASLGGCLAYDGEVQRGYVMDAYELGQIKPGTPAQTVLTNLGTPSTTSTVGGDAWYYISQKVDRPLAFSPPQVTDQHIVAVYFDKTKKVTRVANYGLEDGKVIDFVSRTTPTGGAEQGFLKNLFRSLLRFSS
ncbi:outer membrane protein assembly factor BamE [Lichenihabitans sp. Uapishka_5]|nr:outer membrane protein assembly factor BamE [Lichenihabitans sp. Uapishka_5]